MAYGFPGIKRERNHILVGRTQDRHSDFIVARTWVGIDQDGRLEDVLTVSSILGLVPYGVESTPGCYVPRDPAEARAYFKELGVSDKKYEQVIAPALNRQSN